MMESSQETYKIPASTPFEAVYPLTVNDSIVPPVNNAMAFIYRTTKADEATLSAQRVSLIERLKSSLQDLLQEPIEGVHGYPELLGKLYEDPKTRMVSIKITKSSAVPFIVSYRPDVTYEQLRPDLNFPSDCLAKSIFAPRFTNPAFPDSTGAYEGFWAQLTFIKGGFVLVTCRHHWLADGNGLAAFLRLWFQRARMLHHPATSDKKVDVVSVDDAIEIHQRSLLYEEKNVTQLDHPEYIIKPGSGRILLPGIPLLPRWLFTVVQCVMAALRLIPWLGPTRPQSEIFHFKPESLLSLKTDIQASSLKGKVLSVNDLLLALLWRCITRARCPAGADRAGLSTLATPINMRRRLDPPLPEAWFGNAIYMALPSMPIEDIIGSISLGELAQCIKTATAARATDHQFRSNTQFIKSQKCITDTQLRIDSFRGKDILGSNWMWFFPNMEDLDLGFGEFQRMRWPEAEPFNGSFVILPAFGLRDVEGHGRYPGGLEVRVELASEVMERLKGDEEFKKFATWYT